MVQIRWTKLAVLDLHQIYLYISNDSVKYAKIQIVRIKNKTKLLERHPYLGKPVPEIVNSIYREIIVGRYRIIYKIVSEHQVDIITIHHSLRLLNTLEVD